MTLRWWPRPPPARVRTMISDRGHGTRSVRLRVPNRSSWTRSATHSFPDRRRVVSRTRELVLSVLPAGVIETVDAPDKARLRLDHRIRGADLRDRRPCAVGQPRPRRRRPPPRPGRPDAGQRQAAPVRPHRHARRPGKGWPAGPAQGRVSRPPASVDTSACAPRQAGDQGAKVVPQDRLADADALISVVVPARATAAAQSSQCSSWPGCGSRPASSRNRSRHDVWRGGIGSGSPKIPRDRHRHALGWVAS